MATEDPSVVPTPLELYAMKHDDSYRYEHFSTIPGRHYTTYVIRLMSQEWLTREQVKDPVWWHWLTVVVPNEIQHEVGLLWIGGGSRESEPPEKAPDYLERIATATKTVTAIIHNVPNQPLEFMGDAFGPRKEDELIAYAWRVFLEGGAKDEDAIWLPRLPMTKSAVRAMDAITDFCKTEHGKDVGRFVVAGGSKRGWTTWTTAIVDRRVIAIAPIVIDLLNLVPSFAHHWRTYGFWAPAVGDYVREDMPDWRESLEYARILEIVEPYSYRERLTLPKFLVNSTGDQFFLPDSWQFYWDDLVGEKHIRYVPNTDHSLDKSNAMESFEAFYAAIAADEERPRFEWRRQGDALYLTTDSKRPPSRITLWQASNAQARDFRLETIGEAWTPTDVQLSSAGKYSLSVSQPSEGWTAFLAELSFPGSGENEFIFSSGVVIVPDDLSYPPYKPEIPRGKRLEDSQ